MLGFVTIIIASIFSSHTQSETIDHVFKRNVRVPVRLYNELCRQECETLRANGNFKADSEISCEEIYCNDTDETPNSKKDTKPKQEDADIHTLQSKTKPLPDFLKNSPMINHGTLGSPDPKVEYLTPPGFRLKVIAEQPTVINPVGMTFDNEGNLYVLEWPAGETNSDIVKQTTHYKDGTNRVTEIMRKFVITTDKAGKTTTKTLHDKINILRLDPKSGMYNRSELLIDGEELPSSIMFHEGWLYLSGQGSIRRYRQSIPGGKYDIKETIAKGFCGFHHHQVSGMTIGADGWLYITSGDNDNVVEGSDGSRATILRTGGVFRCKPDGSKMEVYSTGFRNPYRDITFSPTGQLHHVDNDNEDGGKWTGCRLMNVQECADYGWRLKDGNVCCKADMNRSAVFGELTGKMPPMLKTGRGAPAGLMTYNDSYLPKVYQDLLFYPDVFQKNIRAYKVSPTGASFKVDSEFELLKSNDPLFRPAQMVTGPDGAMYVVDWRTNSTGAGRLSGDGVNGRIYQLSWAGTQTDPEIKLRGLDSWSKIKDLNTHDQFKVLEGMNQSDRDRVQRLLVEKARNETPTNRPIYDSFVNTLRNSKVLAARVSALGAFYSYWDSKAEDLMRDMLKDPESDIRRLAAEALGRNSSSKSHAVQLSLTNASEDKHPQVKRAAVLALGKLATPETAEIIAKVFTKLTHEEQQDKYLADGVVRALERVGRPGIIKLVEMTKSDNAALRKRAIEAIQSLRTREGFEALSNLLLETKLSLNEKANLLSSTTNYLLDPPVDTEKLITTHFEKNPKEDRLVKLAALDVLTASKSLKNPLLIAWVSSLINTNDKELSLEALSTLEENHATQATAVLIEQFSKNHSGSVRAAILRTLISFKDTSLKNKLPSIVTNEQDPEVKLAAFNSLIAIDPVEAKKLAPQLILHKNDDIQKSSMTILSNDEAGVVILGKSLLQKKIALRHLPFILESLKPFETNSLAVRDLKTQIMKIATNFDDEPENAVFKLPADSNSKEYKDKIAKITKGVESADPHNGLKLFLNSDRVSCISCHKIGSSGGGIGPVLSGLNSDVRKIVEDIILPSNEIKEGFGSHKFTMADGKTVQGMIKSKTEKHTVVIDSNGAQVTLANEDIEKSGHSKNSIMPEKTLSGLSYKERLDLIAFIKNKELHDSMRSRAFEFWVSGPYDNSTKAHAPQLDPEKLDWKLVRTEATGSLNLRAIYDKDNISVYARTYVYSPEESEAELILGSDDGVKVWLNADKNPILDKHDVARGANPEEDQIKIKLKKGWNSVMFQVFNGAAGHELYAKFKGKDLLVDPKQGNTSK